MSFIGDFLLIWQAQSPQAASVQCSSATSIGKFTMTKAHIAGILRAVIPAAVAYAAGKGFDLSALATPEAIDSIAAVVVAGCAVWSVTSKRNTVQLDSPPDHPNP
jgi:hypothetical protein